MVANYQDLSNLYAYGGNYYTKKLSHQEMKENWSRIEWSDPPRQGYTLHNLNWKQRKLKGNHSIIECGARNHQWTGDPQMSWRIKKDEGDTKETLMK